MVTKTISTDTGQYSIVIDPAIVRISETVKDAELKMAECMTSQMAQQVLGYNKPALGILPPGVRWVSKEGDSYIIEQPPQYMTITFQPGNEENVKPETMYTLPMPWLVYAIRFFHKKKEPFKSVGQIYIFARNSQIASVNDLLYSLPLPNMTGAEACLGHYFEKEYSKLIAYNLGYKGVTEAATALNTAISLWWGSSFNNDTTIDLGKLPTNIPGVKKYSDEDWFDAVATKKTVKWLRYWEELTIPNVLKWELTPAGMSLAQLMAEFEATYLSPSCQLPNYLAQLINKAKAG